MGYVIIFVIKFEKMMKLCIAFKLKYLCVFLKLGCLDVGLFTIQANITSY